MLVRDEENQITSENQFGFGTKKSTEDALQQMIEHVDEIKKCKYLCAAVSIDIQGAFDNISWRHVFGELRKDVAIHATELYEAETLRP